MFRETIRWLRREIARPPEIDDYKIPVTWMHPALGRFERPTKSPLWSTRVKLSAFTIFSYTTGHSNDPPNNGWFNLILIEPDKAERPSARSVEFAERVVANQQELAVTICDALWQDISGTGVSSHTWWSNNLKKIAEDFEGEKLPPPTCASDLASALRLNTIYIKPPSLPHQEYFLADFSFRALFEPEHAVSILTDAHIVRGIGINFDMYVLPFDATVSPEEPEKPSRKIKYKPSNEQ